MPKLYVLSLGGSLIAPGELDHKFLKSFRAFIAAQIKKGNRFVIVVGGGSLARNYRDALRRAGNSSPDDLDWVGIAATRLNAKLIRLMFGPLAHADIISDPNKKVVFREKILVAGGWKPGRTTDDDAVRLAKVYGSSTIINFTNVDFVYDKDPRKYKNARKIEAISWKDYSKMFGVKHTPGLHAPFDPVAARFAKLHNQKVIIANGKNLNNIEKVLAGKRFKGTILS